MRVFRWLFIVGAVVLLAGITAGAVWLNTFIHSASFREEVETRAGRTLGGPVQIQGIELSLFSGVKLRGLTTQMDPGKVNGQGTLLVKVESVNCTYSWGDLLSGRLTLTGVTLEKPELVLSREGLVPAEAPETAPRGPGTGDEGGKAPPPFKFVLESAKIRGGSFSLRDATGAALTELSGVEAEADTSGFDEGRNITGKLKIADLAFGPNVHVTDLSSPWIFDPHGNFITAKPFEAAAFGGRLAGDYVLDGTGPSLLEVNAQGLDTAQIGRTVRSSSSARLSGLLDVQSKWRGAESGELQGEGDAQLAKGKLAGVRVLRELAGILRVPEMAAPNLNSVQTHFEVADGRTRFTGLELDSDGFQMTGDGVIGAGGALDANMVLILSSDSMSRLPREAALFFVQQPSGAGTIGFHLGGTINNPKTDLATRILMQGAAVKDVISNALNRFFHKHTPPPASEAPPPEETSPQGETPAAGPDTNGP